KPGTRLRVWPFLSLTVVMMTILVARLTQLTVVEGAYQRSAADENRLVGVRLMAPRGVLLDRRGQTLVRNVPFYKRQVPGTTVHEAKFEPLTKDEVIKLALAGSGERVVSDITREYICGRACASVLGYTGEVTKTELNELGREYALGDSLGKAGLEKVYERRLRGLPGMDIWEVGADGQIVRAIGQTTSQAGQDVQLTLDRGLQDKLYQALAGYKGAVVAQVPQTGEVLALVSTPAFDPNQIAVSLTEADEPFFNRALGGAYPPGSVFKIVTAVAALESGAINRETLLEDSGEIVIGPYRYGNWLFEQYGRTEGSINLVRAIQRSNDVFFYQAGERTTAEKIAEWARLFGFDSAYELAGFGAVAGTIPDPAWKEKVKGERWFLGNTYHMAIGQGDVLVTPLQINRMMGAIAANGVLCPVVLAKDEGQGSGCQQLNLAPSTLEIIKEGLTLACQPGGTGVPFFDSTIKVACKTGTAQQGSEAALPHAWFTVYAPAENPSIVLTVMLEHAGQGSEVAAPIAKIALDYWWQTEGNPVSTSD
ncbi:hypothetical protein A2W24_06795, partial [Microgenomates group bacterium RBG_16_45_19]